MKLTIIQDGAEQCKDSGSIKQTSFLLKLIIEGIQACFFYNGYPVRF